MIRSPFHCANPPVSLPTRCIRLHLDGDPADYTTDARTDNVVRIGSKNIR